MIPSVQDFPFDPSLPDDWSDEGQVLVKKILRRLNDIYSVSFVSLRTHSKNVSKLGRRDAPESVNLYTTVGGTVS